MRILHTSDWHIGRTFHAESVREHLESVLGTLPTMVTDHAVDLVCVSGDIFDSSIPPAWAFDLLTELLVRIRAVGATVVISSGNHDSAERLRYMAPLAALGGVHVCATPLEPCRPIILHDDHGAVRVYAMPYLEPVMLRTRGPQDAADVRTQDDAIAWATNRIRTNISAEDEGARTVVLAHCFAAGVPANVPGADLERDLTAGGLDVVSTDHFAGFDYVALGHIHSRMKLSEAIRYSGAPLHYSFTEAGQPRGAWLVELDSDGLRACDWLDFPVPRRLHKLEGNLQELLTNPEFAAYEDCWLQITLTDTLRPIDTMNKLRDRFPYVVHLLFAPRDAPKHTDRYRTRLASLTTDRDRMEAFLTLIRGASATTEHEQWQAEVSRLDELIAEQTMAETSR